MQRCIGNVYANLDLACDTFPADDQVDPNAYTKAIASFAPGDVAIIFTPDDTHFDICLACVQHGLHVLVTKPLVQTLAHHQALAKAADEHGVLVAMEVHKRWDPFYVEARDRIRNPAFGDFQYLYAYMSQPKHQLETFKAWAGKSSDISYYLNSHHIDWSEWALAGRARPIRVTATGSYGVARQRGMDTEDSITLQVQWENMPTTTTLATDDKPIHNNTPRTMGCAVYTASWVAPKSDVHSQQRFFYMGSHGEITVDQAHRGCTVATDDGGFASINPLFMKYTPSQGQFAGQGSYGIMSLERFVDASQAVRDKIHTANDFNDGSLATVHTTLQGTAILEAGRKSLDSDSQPMDILYDGPDGLEPIGIQPHVF
jgi:D-galacturonate reductase